MKTLKLIAIAITATLVAAPAFAGPDATWNTSLARAYERANAQKALAGPTGPAGQVGPATSRPTVNLGHPTERVRR